MKHINTVIWRKIYNKASRRYTGSDDWRRPRLSGPINPFCIFLSIFLVKSTFAYLSVPLQLLLLKWFVDGAWVPAVDPGGALQVPKIGPSPELANVTLVGSFKRLLKSFLMAEKIGNWPKNMSLNNEAMWTKNHAEEKKSLKN